MKPCLWCYKLKKILVLAVLFSLLVPIAVSQGSAWNVINYPWVKFLVTGSGLHLAQDPLFLTSDLDAGYITFGDTSAADYVKGWVTFTCATNGHAPEGFEYTVAVDGIERGSYDVYAHFPNSVLLGTLNVGGNGEGELQGFYDLDAGFYEVQIIVELDGVEILRLHDSDLVDFGVVQ